MKEFYKEEEEEEEEEFISLIQNNTSNTKSNMYLAQRGQQTEPISSLEAALIQ